MSEDVHYKVTGVLVSGRRFAPMFFESFMHAAGVNLWRGSVWEIHPDGKTYLMWRVFN